MNKKVHLKRQNHLKMFAKVRIMPDLIEGYHDAYNIQPRSPENE